MAHEISVLENGFAEAMYAEKPAWHNLGKVTEKAFTSEECLEQNVLNWEVEKQPIYLGDGSKVEDYFATVRKDTGKTLGVVQSRYEVWQNRQAFSFLDSFAQDNVIRYESAMALREGRRVVLLARMPSVDQVTAKDVSLRYLLCSTSHDGSLAITLQPTSVRVVCANTLAIAMKDGQYRVQVKHTASMEDRLKEARFYLSQFDKAFTQYNDKAKILASVGFDPKQAKEFMETLFPNPKDSATDRVKNNHAKKIQQLRDCYQVEKGLVPELKNTWWCLFNSVTRYVDHVLTGKGGNDREREENRFLNVMEGNGMDLKELALQTALQMAV